MSDIKKIIFLDIDGVLCLRDSRYLFFNVDCLNRLQRIIKTTDSHIVISSAWRVGRELIELQDIFSKNGDCHDQYTGSMPPFDVERIIGKTPPSISFSKKNDDDLWGRGLEIDTWLKKDGKSYNIEKYIIIDDEISDLGPFKASCIKTDTITGLTEELAEEAIRRLS